MERRVQDLGWWWMLYDAACNGAFGWIEERAQNYCLAVSSPELEAMPHLYQNYEVRREAVIYRFASCLNVILPFLPIFYSLFIFVLTFHHTLCVAKNIS